MTAFLPLGRGIPDSSDGAERWLRSTDPSEGWRPMKPEDQFEFDLAPSAPFIIREHETEDVSVEHRGRRFLGAVALLIIFRSGHQLVTWDAPGWHALGRAIREAGRELAYCPALGADAIPNHAPRVDLTVSPLISGFVYVAAPGGMALCHWGARIHSDFDPSDMTEAARRLVGAYQALTDRQRKFDRSRLSDYDGPLPFPRWFLL